MHIYAAEALMHEHACMCATAAVATAGGSSGMLVSGGVPSDPTRLNETYSVPNFQMFYYEIM